MNAPESASVRASYLLGYVLVNTAAFGVVPAMGTGGGQENVPYMALTNVAQGFSPAPVVRRC